MRPYEFLKKNCSLRQTCSALRCASCNTHVFTDTVSWSSWMLWIAAGSSEPPVDFVRMGEGGDEGKNGGVFDRIVIDREQPFEVRHGEEHLEELYNR